MQTRNGISTGDNYHTTVSPNLALKQIAPVGARDTFQAQDVTALIQQGGAGVYTVSNVPGQVAVDGNSIIGNSWNIIVVYENPLLPIRYFDVNTGLSTVSSVAPSAFNFTRFTTPPTGPVKAYINNILPSNILIADTNTVTTLVFAPSRGVLFI